MGVDICTYRIRIGHFVANRKNRRKSKINTKYNPYTNGSDIHYRSFACSLMGLFFAIMFRVAVESHTYIVDNYTSELSQQCVSSCYSSTLSGSINGITSMSPVYPGCVIGTTYASYSSRLLILSSDIELNQGPTEDTMLILKQMQKSHEELDNKLSESHAKLQSNIKDVKHDI